MTRICEPYHEREDHRGRSHGRISSFVLSRRGSRGAKLLAAERLADAAAYVCGSNLTSSHARQIDLVGPPYRDNTWQANAKEGFDVASFRVQ